MRDRPPHSETPRRALNRVDSLDWPPHPESVASNPAKGCKATRQPRRRRSVASQEPQRASAAKGCKAFRQHGRDAAVAQSSAAAPLTISFSSVVMRVWRARLYWRCSDFTSALALSVAAFIAIMRITFSLTTASQKAW